MSIKITLNERNVRTGKFTYRACVTGHKTGKQGDGPVYYPSAYNKNVVCETATAATKLRAATRAVALALKEAGGATGYDLSGAKRRRKKGA